MEDEVAAVSQPPFFFALTPSLLQSISHALNPTLSLTHLLSQLVIDNGSGMCKAGFAGDDAPRAVSSPKIRRFSVASQLLTD